MNRALFDPGALNHRFMLQSVIELSDGCGGIAVTWLDVCEVWASLEPVSQRMQELAQQNQEFGTHRITLRFRDDVASGWRFKQGARHFEVQSVTDPDERGGYLVCMTKEAAR